MKYIAVSTHNIILQGGFLSPKRVVISLPTTIDHTFSVPQTMRSHLKIYVDEVFIPQPWKIKAYW